MTENHLAVVADATVSILGAATDWARIGLAAVEEFSSRSIKVGYHYTAPPIAASKVSAENPRLSVVVLGDCAKIKL
jgi:hypothetical protein